MTLSLFSKCACVYSRSLLLLLIKDHLVVKLLQATLYNALTHDAIHHILLFKPFNSINFYPTDYFFSNQHQSPPRITMISYFILFLLSSVSLHKNEKKTSGIDQWIQHITLSLRRVFFITHTHVDYCCWK